MTCYDNFFMINHLIFYKQHYFNWFCHRVFNYVAFTSPGKISHAHSYMPKSVHMHVKNFTCIASIMHVKFEVHMHDRIVSHVRKDFTCNKMHGKKVHTYDKIFSHVLNNFTCMSKSSHACEMLM